MKARGVTSPKTPMISKKPAPFTQLNQSLIERPISLDIFRPESPSTYSAWMTNRNNHIPDQSVLQLIKVLEEKIEAEKLQRLSGQKSIKAQLFNSKNEIIKTKEECMQFCRQYFLEANNTLIHEKKEKQRKIIKDIFNEEKQSLEELMSSCSATVDKFKNQQQKIMQNLLDINKNTYQQFRDIQKNIGLLTQQTQFLKEKFNRQENQQKQQLQLEIIKITKNINKFKSNVETVFKEQSEQTNNRIRNVKEQMERALEGIIEQYNNNFMEVEKNSKDTMKIAKEMVELAGHLSKQIGKIKQNQTFQTICQFMRKIDQRLYEGKENMHSVPKDV